MFHRFISHRRSLVMAIAATAVAVSVTGCASQGGHAHDHGHAAHAKHAHAVKHDMKREHRSQMRAKAHKYKRAVIHHKKRQERQERMENSDEKKLHWETPDRPEVKAEVDKPAGKMEQIF